MVYKDFQKHYESLIFIDDFLEEIVNSRVQVLYSAWF
jgi:hypothetical protein